MIQLSKKVQELKEKEVVAIAVQASNIDRNELDEWAKKYHIPFTVGMIRGDTEKVRLEWGVKSLPWLILTDSKHAVYAEGFSLGELENKLGQSGDKQ